MKILQILKRILIKYVISSILNKRNRKHNAKEWGKTGICGEENYFGY